MIYWGILIHFHGPVLIRTGVNYDMLSLMKFDAFSIVYFVILLEYGLSKANYDNHWFLSTYQMYLHLFSILLSNKCYIFTLHDAILFLLSLCIYMWQNHWVIDHSSQKLTPLTLCTQTLPSSSVWQNIYHITVNYLIIAAM